MHEVAYYYANKCHIEELFVCCQVPEDLPVCSQIHKNCEGMVGDLLYSSQLLDLESLRRLHILDGLEREL